MSLWKELKSIFATNEGKAILKVFFGLSAISAVLIVLTFNWAIEFSSFAVGIFKSFLGIFLFWLFDRFAIPEVDTMEELKKGNIAYALFLVAIAIIFGLSIFGS